MKIYNSFQLKTIFNSYFEILLFTPSRSESLRLIAEKASEDFGDFITPGNLCLYDEIEINLIELLDQIIYEFRENTEDPSSIRDYIIEDLYTRISLNLEALQDLNLYKKNIINRSLIYDDVIIIRSRGLADFIPMLIRESEEITNLQIPIIKAFLYFNDPSFADFYYNSYNNSQNGFIRSAAFLGLKYYDRCAPARKSSADSDITDEETFDYIEKFDLNTIYSNPLPSNKEEITFALLHLEKNIKTIDDFKTVRWLLSCLGLLSSMNFDNPWFHEINSSLSTILLNINLDRVKQYVDKEEKLIKAACFIDNLPKNIFNRLTGRLDLLGMDFQFRLNTIIEKKKISVNNDNSNIFNYLCWNSTDPV